MNPDKPAPEPSAEQIETARLIVSKMLQFEEAAWGPVAVLIAEHDVKLQAELDAVKARFVIDTCDSQHKFVKLDGKETRCPECLAIGLALAREDLAQARAALAECQKDRERLDWLGNCGKLKTWGININGYGYVYVFSTEHSTDSLREAIDKALAGGENANQT